MTLVSREYVQMEDRIGSLDGNVIRQKIRFGKRLLADPNLTREDGRFHNRALQDLVETLASEVRAVSQTEIQRRKQAAQRYPSEAHEDEILKLFRTWWDLVQDGFPEVDVSEPEAAAPKDDLENTPDLGYFHDQHGGPEGGSARGQEGGSSAKPGRQPGAGSLPIQETLFGEQFFVVDTFDPSRTKLRQMKDYCSVQERDTEMLYREADNARQADEERRAIVNALIEAADGDEEVTWEKASKLYYEREAGQQDETGDDCKSDD